LKNLGFFQPCLVVCAGIYPYFIGCVIMMIDMPLTTGND